MTKSIYTVYKTTNTINNKIYIGVHFTPNPNDSYFGSGIIIKSSIKKYGKENFIKSILFEFDNPEDAYLKESQIVNNSFIHRTDTYNIALGGNLATSGERNYQFNGYWVTPNGNFTSSKIASEELGLNRFTLKKWCKNPEIEITNYSYSRCPFLSKLDSRKNLVGKTVKSIGFDYQ